METLQDLSLHFKVAEIQLSYQSKIKFSELPKVTCSADAYKLLDSLWDKTKIDLLEEFKVMLLNKANKVLGVINLASGGVDATVADQRLIFAAALKANATAIILAHNHPSGRLVESAQDRNLTEKMVKAGEILNIAVLDHFIISSEGYFSFADKGLL
ncbi:JAB domain-containing protein [Solitalea canadensis]|uniref:DNA repair protein n=1 Tax=Solitalea canadensis (strain ATCC 29591 / DSM 3403 / JCM 21819 / LMG 8368 / NBRC 15130 / NCIMB 12057 / USAM 9D) TaxID=929556 RepID=H8KNS2_SOLCM|nr:JAB domain-containing protein [Solitalea canadensis]AFD05333.1 DNA repair protein [Solitalea canadensis DSM 3403]